MKTRSGNNRIRFALLIFVITCGHESPTHAQEPIRQPEASNPSEPSDPLKDAQRQYVNKLKSLSQRLLEHRDKDKPLNTTLQQLEEHLAKASDVFPKAKSRILRVQDPEVTEPMKVLVECIDKIRALYPDKSKTEIDKLVFAAAEGMMKSLDPYSRFLDESGLAQYQQEVATTYTGIGLYSSHVGEYPTAYAFLYEGPAFAAGMRTHDRIVAIAGVDTKGYTAEQLGKLTLGEPGTKVQVSVLRAGWEKPRAFEITRRAMEAKAVEFEAMPGGIGYIRIRHFGSSALVKELDVALNQLDQNDALFGLILDLRGNPGGDADLCAQAVSRFLDGQKIVAVGKTRGRIRNKVMTRVMCPKWLECPMVVLVDGRSASAAEMFSGALKSHGRAVILGEKTFGKGVGQSQVPLTSGGGQYRLYMSTVQYNLPKSGSFQGVGVEPHIVVPSAKPDPDQLAQIERLKTTNAFMRYDAKWYQGHKQRFKELVIHDHNDPSRYPGFDALHEEIGSIYNRDLLRDALRQYLRGRLADDRRAHYLADVQQDEQLQRAVYELADKIYIELKMFPAYTALAKKFL